MERYFDCSCDCVDCAVVDCDFVKNAVAKQISKKVILKTTPKTSWTRASSRYECPCCNIVIGFNLTNYCSCCGQKLDWESEC